MIRTGYAVAIALLLAACAMHFTHGDAGDKAWQLYAARQFVLGQRLYVDVFFDINTPLLVWLYAIPSYIALHLPWISDSQTLVLLGLATTAGVIAVSLRLIALHPGFTLRDTRRQFALLLACMFVFYTNAGYFFHREEIFLLLAFPYLLRFMPSLARRKLPLWLSILIGAMAGIGFSMKPHCLLIFAGAQLVTLLRERSLFILFSVENMLVYALSLLYALAVWHFTPQYFTLILPMAMATYGATNRSLQSIVYITSELGLLALPFADFRMRYASPYRRDIFYLLALCVFFFAYALLNNGWGYTYNLVNLMIVLLTGFLLLEYRFLRQDYAARGANVKPFIFGMRACWTSFAINAIFTFYVIGQILLFPCSQDNACTIQTALTKEVTRDGRLHSFSALSIEFNKWVVLARETGAPWESRFHHLWMLPKFFSSDATFTQAHQPVLDTVGHALAEDLDRRQPEIVFVDDTDHFFTVHRHVDLVAYMSQMPEFARAFAPYRYAYSINECKGSSKRACKYDVYRRH